MLVIYLFFTSMSFDENVKHWVQLDNQLKTLSEKSKELREQRSATETEILNYVESNRLSNATVNISDGRLRFVQTKQVAPLTLKYVEECLAKCISNTEQIGYIMQVIKENREVKQYPDIKRYYSKS